MAYLTRAEFLDRYDPRRVGSLVSDNDTRVPQATMEAGDDILDAILADAESFINSALHASDRYEETDLAALTGDDLAILKRLNADIAYGLLIQRRGHVGSVLETEAPGYSFAMQFLQMLRTGERVLNIATAKRAGNPTNQKLSTKIDRVTDKSDRYFGDFICEQLQEPPF